MAECMAPTGNINDDFLIAYKQWAEGGWGMVLTGRKSFSMRMLMLNKICRKCNGIGNVPWATWGSAIRVTSI